MTAASLLVFLDEARAGKKVFVLTTHTKEGVFEAHVLLVEKEAWSRRSEGV
jgi:hypothetical protein